MSQGKCAEFSLPSVQIPATTRQPTPTIRQRIQSAVRQPVVRTSSSEGAPADTRDVQRINAVTSRQQVQTTARIIQPTKPGINTQQLCTYDHIVVLIHSLELLCQLTVIKPCSVPAL